MDSWIEVGIDIGGTKMLLLAQGKDFRTRLQLATGGDFSGADAEMAIAIRVINFFIYFYYYYCSTILSTSDLFPTVNFTK